MNKSLNTLYCSKCGSLDIETKMWVNPNTEQISGHCSDISEKEDNWCKACEEHTELLTLQELWNRFGDIAINNDDEIESDFMQFEEGTDRFYIWDWFDERCPNNLHDDLLYANVEEED